jgi:nucleotide-binding universal stress UspA family protein
VTGTILVAVSDSPAAFKAAGVAADYARRLGASVRAVVVIESGVLDKHLNGTAETAHRRQLAAEAALRHVAALCATAGVEVTGSQRAGTVAAEILEEARAVDAMLIVMACVDRPGRALPYIGSQTLRVLEFAEVPVLVVPAYHAG